MGAELTTWMLWKMCLRLGEGDLVHSDNVREAVLDATIQAVNEASATDFLRCLTPEAVVDAMDPADRISASAVRRHFEPDLGERFTRRELQTEALIEEVQSWVAPLIETNDLTGRDALRRLFLHPYRGDNELVYPAGVDAIARIAIAAADTDPLARGALRAAFLNCIEWVEPALPDDPAKRIRAFGLAALRFADVMSSRPTDSRRPPMLSASGTLTAMGAMAGMGIEDVKYRPPALPRVRIHRRTKHQQVEGRRAAIVAGALRVIAASSVDDFLSFLTPMRVQSFMQLDVDRTTVGYHLARAPFATGQGRTARLLELVDRRIQPMSEKELLRDYSSVGPGGTTHSEIDAKRRIRLVALAAGEAFESADGIVVALRRRHSVFVARENEAHAFAEFIRRAFDARWFLEAIGLGRQFKVDSSRWIPGVAELVGRLLAEYQNEEWLELVDAIVASPPDATGWPAPRGG